MERPVRIAVVGPVEDRLVGELRRLPLGPEVRQWPDLVSDSEALTRFQPEVLAIALPADDAAEHIGALRFLRQLWPTLGVLVVTSPARELADAPLAQRLRALLLVYPGSPGQLAASIEQVRLGVDRPLPDVFVDLARGLADEINNPLMFASGHLQLLRAGFEAKSETDRRDQVSSAMSGLARIQKAVDRLRLCAQAANGPRRREAVDLRALFEAALATRTNDKRGHATSTIADGPHTVLGDLDQLTAAVACIVTFADELADQGNSTSLSLDALTHAQRFRIVAIGPAVVSWQMPHTFEPFYPSRALRGHGLGLGLFLTQTVVLGHRGQATVQRLADGSLQFDFALPE